MIDITECPYGRSGDSCVPVMHDYPCICELKQREAEQAKEIERLRETEERRSRLALKLGRTA